MDRTAWEVVYKDKSILRQYVENEEERLFKDIDQERLFEFRIYHNGKILSYFPDTGTFGINGFLYNTDLSHKNIDYRLIYFKRNRKVLGNGEDTELHFLGFQVTIDGKNYKRMFSVGNNQIQLVSEGGQFNGSANQK